MSVQPGVDTLRLEDSVVDAAGEPRDLSAATAIICVLRSPDSTEYIETGTWVNDGTDGKAEAYYTNTINIPGWWSFQFDFTGISPGNVHRFEVDENLNAIVSP